MLEVAAASTTFPDTEDLASTPRSESADTPAAVGVVVACAADPVYRQMAATTATEMATAGARHRRRAGLMTLAWAWGA